MLWLVSHQHNPPIHITPASPTSQYASSSLLLDIAATLREPVVKNTRKAVATSNATFFTLYAAVAITNYGALGNAAQGDILTNYTSPSWLIVVANFAVVLHLLPAFQVYAQTFFSTVDTLRRLRNPNTKKMRWWTTALWRAAYVLVCTAIGAAFPFFSSICMWWGWVVDVGGVGGAVGGFGALYVLWWCVDSSHEHLIFTHRLVGGRYSMYGWVGVPWCHVQIPTQPHITTHTVWPLVVFYPIVMWVHLHNPGTSVRIAFHCLNVLACALSICALSGSFYSFVQSVNTFSIGGSR